MNKVLLVFFIVFVTAPAFSQSFRYGVAASLLNPAGDFDNTHGNGVAVKAIMELRVPGPLSFTGEVGWNKWRGKYSGPSEIADKVAWSALGGLKINIIGPLYAEGRAGYYFGDIDSFAFIPAIGLRVRRLDLNLAYQTLYDIQFADARIGIFLNNR